MLTFEQAFELAEKSCVKAEAVYSQAKKILRGKKPYDFPWLSKARRDVDYLGAVHSCELEKLWKMTSYMRKIDADRYFAVAWYFRASGPHVWDL